MVCIHNKTGICYVQNIGVFLRILVVFAWVDKDLMKRIMQQSVEQYRAFVWFYLANNSSSLFGS